jgi:hypothetical protein
MAFSTLDWRRRTAAPPAPGLTVTMNAELVDDIATPALSVRLRVDGGRDPVRLSLYLDGELVDSWIPGRAGYEFRMANVRDGRRVVTARAVDAIGRWGGASAVVDLNQMSIPRA